MSYAVRLAGDVIADLRQLDPQLQEDVLDELDSLANGPESLRTDASGEAIFDFARGEGAARHVIFLRLHRDDVNRVLTVLAIAAAHRPSLEA